MSVSEGSSLVSDLFITEVDAERKLKHVEPDLDLLINVRKDHVKVREVVNAFRAKVDRLIDKQRHEYIQAYENHMQDVQKELHAMREKVFEIANDDTKNERTEKLKSDLDSFKDEAIRLETDADELRITMSTLVRRIYAVERSRDWMLKKLRQAKKKYNHLIKHKVKLLESHSQASLSNDSSYTIEMRTEVNNTYKIEKFAKGLVSNTRVGRSIPLPMVRNTAISDNNKSSFNTFGNNDKKITSLSIERRPNILSGLVAVRTSHEEVKSFVQQCSVALHRRPWCKVQRRPFHTLLRDCLFEITAGKSTEEILVPLACELSCSTELYDILGGLLVLHYEKLPRKRKDSSCTANSFERVEPLSSVLVTWD